MEEAEEEKSGENASGKEEEEEEEEDLVSKERSLRGKRRKLKVLPKVRSERKRRGKNNESKRIQDLRVFFFFTAREKINR